MNTTYYYIDDDPQSKQKIQGFENENLSIKAMQHKNSWEEQLIFFKENEHIFDGLILDLKLDDLPNDNNIRAAFRGTSLAQEIRTRQKEGVLKPFPIILFSANDQIEKALEKSGIDLFDVFIDKSKVNDTIFSEYNSQFIDLSNGYVLLSDPSIKADDVFKINECDLDSRFLSEYDEIKKSPVHIQSRFILTELLCKQGLLVDESILAARLGIDKKRSEDWDKLLENISSTKYNGVFSHGWSRWWMHLIEQWWDENNKSNAFLRSMSANERVEEIKQFTHLTQLKVAEKIAKSNSDAFWTICKAYNYPLDPIDGLLIQGQDNLYSWQEPEYVSVEAALNRKNIDNWVNVADIDQNRYKTLKKLYSRTKL